MPQTPNSLPSNSSDSADLPSGPKGPLLTRREFLISLGAAAGAGIVGYFLTLTGTNDSGGVQERPTAGASHPALKENTILRTDGDLTTLHATDGSTPASCAVNHHGAEVLRRLDGNHSIAAISEAVARAAKVPRTETLDARIACFVAQLGMLGLLREPFYAELYRVAQA